jgi:hypothetical protein
MKNMILGGAHVFHNRFTVRLKFAERAKGRCSTLVALWASKRQKQCHFIFSPKENCLLHSKQTIQIELFERVNQATQFSLEDQTNRINSYKAGSNGACTTLPLVDTDPGMVGTPLPHDVAWHPGRPLAVPTT